MKHKKKAIIPAVAVLLIGVSAFAWKTSHGDALTVSGTLEARNISVGSKVGGRVSQVLIHEGDRVQPGQLLVEFDSSELEGQLLQAQGRVEAARAELDKMLRGSRPEEIAEAQAAVRSTEGAPGFREAELAQARADLQRAQADNANAERELGRATELARSGIVAQQVLDNAEDRYHATKAQVDSSQYAVVAAEGRLTALTYFGRLLCLHIDGARYFEIKGASHGVTLQRPYLVNQLLRDHFLGAASSSEREDLQQTAIVIGDRKARPRARLRAIALGGFQ